MLIQQIYTEAVDGPDASLIWIVLAALFAILMISMIVLLPPVLSRLPADIQRRIGWSLAGALLLVSSYGGWRLVGAARDAVNTTQGSKCYSNLRNLASTASMYAADSDDTLPVADHWMDRLKVYATEDISFQCPAAKEFGYAFNRKLSEAKLGKIEDPDRAPLLYDSSNLAPNANDPFTSLPNPARHGRSNIAYANGRVKSIVISTPSP